MRETEVDGVPVLWADVPGPLIATLLFGCGVRDETFRTIGVTHLVEHLAMSALPQVHYERNAAVNLADTWFLAAGRPEHVVEFLGGLCDALGALPMDALAREAGVLAAEGARVPHSTEAVLLSHRYGTAGPGLVAWDGPGYDRLTKEHVADHARRYFVRGNAVLTLTGPPPEGLRLPLPDGPAPEHAEPSVLSWQGPRYATEPIAAPGLALSGPTADPVVATAHGVLRERLLTTARHELGTSCEVGGTSVLVTPDRGERIVWLDPREGQQDGAAELLWETAVDLAEHGPTEAELAHDVAGLRHAVEHPYFPVAQIDRDARARLLGLPHRTAEQLVAEAEAVTAADVTGHLEEALGTALVVIGEESRAALTAPGGQPVCRGGCPRLAEPPTGGRTVRPNRVARVLNRQLRTTRIVLDGAGLAYVDPEGDAHDVRFADVVGVQSDEDGRTLFTRHGCVVPVWRSLWGGAQAVIDAVDRHVPDELHYEPTGLR